MSQPISALLDDIQHSMEAAGVWQTIAPEPSRMMSTEPFSIDTLSFTEWLQWIYVARLRALIEAQGQLPSGAQVLPYAEEALKADKLRVPGLLECIERLDDLLK